MTRTRSDGVLVLGIMAIIFGAWSLLHYFGSSFIFLKDFHLYSLLLESKGGIVARLIYFGAIADLIIYLLFIVSGFAVLKLRNWGRILLICASIMQLVTSLSIPYMWTGVMSNDTHQAMVIPTPIPILYVINIWFFNKKHIREQFRR